MLSLNPFHGRSEGNIQDCLGAILVRSWYLADGPPSHANLDAQFEWLSFLLSEKSRVLAAGLHVAYSQCRSQIMNDKSALEALEQQHYRLQCSFTPIYCLPTEIIMEILRITLDIGETRAGLMHVCRRWWKIIEGMSNIWASLELGARTAPEFVQKSLTRAGASPLSVEINITGPGGMAESGYSALSIAAEYSSQWETLTITSLPQDEQEVQYVNNLLSMHLQPMNRLKHVKFMQSAPSPSPLLDRLLQNIATAAVGILTSMDIHSSPAIQYLIQPAYAPVFGSLTTFTAKVPKMEHPVDLLPHFGQLKTLDLTDVFIPIYDHNFPLPFSHTLCHLHLKAVSIQWMEGHVFSQLESCTIISPLPNPSLQHDVHLPACKELHFENWDFSPVGQFCTPSIDHMRMKGNGWNTDRGNEQVLHLCRAGFGTKLQPRALSLSVVCKDRVLLIALQLLPSLEELSLDLPRPSALGKHFFTGLLAKPGDQLTGKFRLDWRSLYKQDQRGWKPAVCQFLKVLELKYQQWLRPGDNYEFLPPLFAMSWSREKTAAPLRLHVQFQTSPHSWESFELTPQAAMVLSDLKIPDYDQVPYLSLETDSWQNSVYETPQLTPLVHHLQALDIDSSSENTMLNILPSFHQLRELALFNVQVPPLADDVDLPLVHTLRRLILRHSTLAWMDGQVFTQLETFFVNERGWPETFKHKVEMPACTFIGFKQDKLKMLPMLQSNFRFPLLHTLKLWKIWRDFKYAQEGVNALQKIQATSFHFHISTEYQQLLEFLGSKDEMAELELELASHFGAQGILSGLSVVNSKTRELPCSNMKVLRLRFQFVLDTQREQVSQWCIQMMDKRKLAGHSLKRFYIWWDKRHWETDASQVLVTENGVVRMECGSCAS